MEVINILISKFNYKKYLEIGVRNGECIKKIKVQHKDGVDPVLNPYVNFNMTSDDFFSSLDSSHKYDIIFIDGLHTYDQVKKDVLNSLNVLSKNGTIILHDANPKTKLAASESKIRGSWNGTVYQAIMDFRTNRDDLEILTIDTDQGLCIIRQGKQEKINLNLKQCLNFDFFSKHRKLCLNLISIDEFNNWLNNKGK